MHIRRKCFPRDSFTCAKCNFTTSMKSTLTLHVQTIHFGKSIKCARCLKIYKNSRSLASHLNECGEEHYLECYYCSFKSIYKKSMKRHMLRHHIEPLKGTITTMINYFY